MYAAGAVNTSAPELSTAASDPPARSRSDKPEALIGNRSVARASVRFAVNTITDHLARGTSDRARVSTLGADPGIGGTLENKNM
jgi:hypothetical protein